MVMTEDSTGYKTRNPHMKTRGRKHSWGLSEGDKKESQIPESSRENHKVQFLEEKKKKKDTGMHNDT